MALVVSQSVAQKLRRKHGVVVAEVRECFANRTRGSLRDMREQHATHPPTMWFVAETNAGRTLKVVFVLDGNAVKLKTAYEPNETELRIYSSKAR